MLKTQQLILGSGTAIWWLTEPHLAVTICCYLYYIYLIVEIADRSNMKKKYALIWNSSNFLCFFWTISQSSGATTLSIKTLMIMTFSITTFSIVAFSIMTFSITTLSIIKHNGIQHNDIQHNNIQHNDIQHNDIHHKNK